MAKTAKTTKPKTAAKAKTKASPKSKAKAEDDDDIELLEAESESDSEKEAVGKNLVIVESPAKAKTIRKILGSDFQVKASVGHIRDLPKKKLGVVIEENFAPSYEILAEKADVADDLQAAAKRAKVIYLAADPDREGEAIAWHIAQMLEDTKKDIKRIEFHEITKNAIKEALKHPREIDLKRVDAQQARRVLDRLVGYKLSPLLWKKVNKGLSAGRVQSVAVRIICEREAEVQAFVPEEYWTIHTDFAAKKKDDAILHADLTKVAGEKARIPNGDEAQAIVKKLETKEATITAVNERTSKRNPVAPFITSSLQREASNRFGYPVKKTMQIAQKLYEGLELDGVTEGLITYMRTDSTRIAEEAQEEAKAFILEKYGKEYYPETPRTYERKGKNVQGAHEAIRPTSVHRTPEQMQKFLSGEQLKIYKIIWDRFMASQMESAQVKTKSIEITVDDLTLRASHSKVIFPGYMAIYRSEEDEAEEEGNALPELEKGDAMLLKKVEPKQHFTEPPPRFTEASLVKTLEELGIGRPSTYAPTISTIQDRNYVLKQEKVLVPTELGKAVNKLLVDHFANVVDLQFTSDLESRLDLIEETGEQWQNVVGEFFFPFKEELEKAEKEMDKVTILFEGENCSSCGLPMQLKTSRWGSQFLGCTGYPECKTTKPLTKDQKVAPEERPSEEKCEACGTIMNFKYGRFGEYLACPNEDCKATRKIVVKTGVTCPQCKTQELVQRKSRYGKIFYGCPGYPDCNFAVWNKPTGQLCPDCNSLLVEKNLKKGNFEACSSKECKYSRELPTAENAEAPDTAEVPS